MARYAWISRASELAQSDLVMSRFERSGSGSTVRCRWRNRTARAVTLTLVAVVREHSGEALLAEGRQRYSGNALLSEMRKHSGVSMHYRWHYRTACAVTLTLGITPQLHSRSG